LLILLSVVTGAYAFRGAVRATASFVRRQHGGQK